MKYFFKWSNGLLYRLDTAAGFLDVYQGEWIKSQYSKIAVTGATALSSFSPVSESEAKQEFPAAFA